MTFGEKVKEIRKRKGLSQLELGEKMQVSQQAIGKYEKTLDQPKMATVRKIANALGVPLSELVTDWSQFSPEEICEDMQDNDIDYSAIDPRQAVNNNRIINKFHNLNFAGQEKAIEQVELLTKIPEYRKDN